MSRNTGRNKKADADEEEVDDLPDSPFEELEGARHKLHPSYHVRMIEFLAKCDLQAADAQFSLYKYDSYEGGEGKALIDKFYESEPPDEHETGMKYGSGRYMLIMVVPPSGKRERMVRVYKFRIHPMYDKKRQELYGGSAPTAMQPVQQNSEDSFLKAITLLQGLISSFMPLLRPPEQSPDMAKLVNANYALIGDVMKKNMMSNLEMMNDYQRKMSSLRQLKHEGEPVNNNRNDDDGEETNAVMEIIGQIAPMLEQWLPKLVGGGPAAKATAGVIKSTEMFKEIMSNRKLLTGLITYLDQSQGPEQTNKVLSTLGVKRNRPQQKGKAVKNG